jgi:dihydrofolate reductase
MTETAQRADRVTPERSGDPAQETLSSPTTVRTPQEHTVPTRELHATIVSSLDGFYEADGGEYGFYADYEEAEFFRYGSEMLRGYDTLVFGRKTYLLGIKNWQNQPGPHADARVAAPINTHAKIVFSNTLSDDQLKWGDTTRFSDDVVGNVTALKQQPGKDILVIGSTSIRSELLNAGLIDRIKIWYFPIALGSGSSIFKGIGHNITFKTMRATTFHNGIIRVEYDVIKPGD